MSTRGVYPAVQQAFDFIREKLDKGEWHHGSCLPTLRDLSHMAGVSKPVMVKAARLLREKGLITTRERTRMRAGVVPLSNAASSLPQWEKKRTLFEKDLLAGVFGYHGNLPLLKELQARYGVCFGTMKRIMHAMENDGLLRPSGKGYAFTEISARHFKKRILFITSAGHFAQESALNLKHNRIVNLFENECKQNGLSLEIIEIDFFDGPATRRVIGKLPNDETVLGYILDIWWYDLESCRTSYIELMSRLASLKKPAALLDEMGEFDLPMQYTANRLIQVFSIEGKRAGERMARLAIGLGHHSIAYLSSVQEASWSRNRFDGVLGQFSRAGFGSGVHLVAAPYQVTAEYMLAGSGLPDNEIRKLIAIGRTTVQARQLEEQWKKEKANAPTTITGEPQTDAELRKGLASVITIINQGVSEDIIEKMSNSVFEVAQTRVFEMSLLPLFKRALDFKDVTAWICANDNSALAALKFLRDRNIRVPKDISVMGFDNLPPLALEKRLTTLDFNAMGFIRAILGFVLRPPRARGPYKHEAVKVEGIILERNTTGPAKAS